jgi:hypothetical protein
MAPVSLCGYGKKVVLHSYHGKNSSSLPKKLRITCA